MSNDVMAPFEIFVAHVYGATSSSYRSSTSITLVSSNCWIEGAVDYMSHAIPVDKLILGASGLASWSPM